MVATETQGKRVELQGIDILNIGNSTYFVSPVGRESDQGEHTVQVPQYIADGLKVDSAIVDGKTISAEEVDCDFAHATIFPGQSSPIQLVNREGVTDYPIHGDIVILIAHADGSLDEHVFHEDDVQSFGVRGSYHTGDVICCVATSQRGAEFVEQCQPAYQPGDFTELQSDDPRVLVLVKRRNELLQQHTSSAVNIIPE